MVPWDLPLGDKTVVQIQIGGDDTEADKKAKPKLGTLYVLAKAYEKKAAQNGGALTLTSYGKLEPEDQAGNHGFGSS